MIHRHVLILIITVFCLTLFFYPVSAAEPSWTANGTSWGATVGSQILVKWNASGNYNWTPPNGVTNVSYLVIGGGGGGGTWVAGGGGAGGLLYNTTYTVSTKVNITVGAGGISRYTTGYNNLRGGLGGNSSFDTIVALGGGGGGTYGVNFTGLNGGSGGGGAKSSAGGANATAQGKYGGNSTTDLAGAGGGGAGEAGANGVAGPTGGKGGNGTQIAITGNNTWYAGGGGGSTVGGTLGAGGLGGGGAGAPDGGATPGVNGTTGLGAGGGGGYNDATGGGGYGGTGVVIISYTAPVNGVAGFSLTPSFNLTYPVTVQFNDTSTGYPTSWAWNFNDTYTNTTQNPVHVYTVAGQYNISLNASSATNGSSMAYGIFNLSSDSDSLLKSWMHLNSSFDDLQGLAWQNHGASIVATPTKFGGGSLAITSKSQYIFTPSSVNIDLGTNSGEIEFWMNMTVNGSARNMISHTSSDGSGTTGGWGYYMDGNGNHSFWMGSLANSTTSFPVPMGWHHIVISIPASGGGNINIYRDGVIVANGTRPTGNFTVVQPLVIGGGGAAGGHPTYYINEFRYSIGTPRFSTSTFSSPYSAYVGNLNMSYPNINENATLMYKSYPNDSAAVVYNQSPRRRTPQVMNMTNATSIQFAVGYNPAFERALTPIVNHTSYADINFTLITQDSVNGIERVNVFRDSGLGFNASPAGTRTNLVDLPIDYYNYTTEQNFTMSWENATITDGQHNVTYPITHFLYTVVTYGQWTIYPNFSASATTITETYPVTFYDTSLGEPANWTMWNWSFGDGNYSTAQNPTYTYPTYGIYNVSLTSTLVANTSVTNTTTKINYINVTQYPIAVANFIGAPLAGVYPLNVTFNDTSTTLNITSWTWNFNDSSPVVHTQNATHTYTYPGNFSPSLTITNPMSTNTSMKLNYVMVAPASITFNNTTGVHIQGTPQLVLFRVTDMWGSPIVGATVAIQGLTTTAAAWDWLTTMLNLPLGDVPIQNTLMTGVTDTNGGIEFMMVPTTKYSVTTTAVGQTFPTLTIYPHDREYQIVANMIGDNGWISIATQNGTSKTMNVTTTWFTDSIQSVNVTYVDTFGTTTGGWVNITQDGALIQHYTVVSVNFTVNQTLTIPIGGSSAKVTARLTSSQGNVSRDYAAVFKGPALAITGLDANLVMWGAFGLLVLSGLIATATTASTVSIIVCIEAWIYLALGWFNPLVAKIGNDKLVGLFALATFLSIVWNLREGKRQETGR